MCSQITIHVFNQTEPDDVVMPSFGYDEIMDFLNERLPPRPHTTKAIVRSCSVRLSLQIPSTLTRSFCLNSMMMGRSGGKISKTSSNNGTRLAALRLESLTPTCSSVILMGGKSLYSKEVMWPFTTHGTINQ